MYSLAVIGNHANYRNRAMIIAVPEVVYVPWSLSVNCSSMIRPQTLGSDRFFWLNTPCLEV